MGFLINTNLWIAVERGRLNAADIHAITRQAPVYLSPVNLAEIRFGIDLMTDKKHRLRALSIAPPTATQTAVTNHGRDRRNLRNDCRRTDRSRTRI